MTDHSCGTNALCVSVHCGAEVHFIIYLSPSPSPRMMGLFKGSSKALCFVIDTTSSMKDDIATVKNVTSTIINRDVGTANEPSLYILVPFNDPGRISEMLRISFLNVLKCYCSVQFIRWQWTIVVYIYWLWLMSSNRLRTTDKDNKLSSFPECDWFSCSHRWRRSTGDESLRASGEVIYVL